MVQTSTPATHPVLLAQLVALALHRLQHVLDLAQLHLQRLLVLQQLASLARLGTPPPQLPPRALAAPQALQQGWAAVVVFVVRREPT